MLTIEFQVNQDDLVALMRDNLAQLPTYRSQRSRLLRVLWWLFVVVALVEMAATQGSRVEAATRLAPLGILLGLLHWATWRGHPKMLARTAQRLFSARSVPTLIGPQRLEIDRERLVLTNQCSRFEVQWSAVYSVVETKSHVLIAIGEISGIPIAKSTLTGASGEQVVSELRSRTKAQT